MQDGRAEDVATFLADHDFVAEVMRSVLARLAEDGLAEPGTLAAPGDATNGVRRFGRFELVRLLGGGGMGTVHLAVDRELGRQVALKQIRAELLSSPEARHRFALEARAASMLSHPNLCTVHDVGEHDGIPFIVMPFLEGDTLAQAIAASRPAADRDRERTASSIASDDARGIARIVALVETIARAIHHAHEHGLVHRDLKPGNVIVRPDGSPVVLDFGLVHVDAESPLTGSGAQPGTREYMSPEQVRPHGRTIDRRTDVWSLGVMLYECLAHERPFRGESEHDLFQSILAARPTALRALNRRVPRDLEVVVQTAMAPEPEHRYQTALGFADDLRCVLDGRPIAARRASAATRLRRWAKRNPLATALIGTAVTALAVVAVLLSQTAKSRAIAAERLEQFRAAKVEREVRVLREAIRTAPAPDPRSSDQLARLVFDLETAIGRLPELRDILGALRSLGRPVASAPDERRFTRLSFADARDQLAGSPGAMKRRLAELGPNEQPPEEWTSHVASRIAAIEAEVATIDVRLAGRRRFAFAEPADEFLHDLLEDEILELEWMAEHELGELRSRLEWSRNSAKATVTAHAAAWSEVTARVAQDPRFRGAAIGPRPGLVPIGRDPHSELPEFAHVRSGAIPERDASGKLRLGVDSALVFVLLPGGPVVIGASRDETAAPRTDPRAQAEETPLSIAELDPFYASKFEVSHGQWNRLAAGLTAGGQACYFEAMPGWESKPVANIDAITCDDVCRAHGLRLPTEAQWEYACRAGTDSPWWTGDDPLTLRLRENIKDLDAARAGMAVDRDTAPWEDGVFGRRPIWTGSANPFGLHHMHGNVQEWCVEPPVLGAELAPGDGRRLGLAADPTQRSIRGGAYTLGLTRSRSSHRDRAGARATLLVLGLRPVISAR